MLQLLYIPSDSKSKSKKILHSLGGHNIDSNSWKKGKIKSVLLSLEYAHFQMKMKMKTRGNNEMVELPSFWSLIKSYSSMLHLFDLKC